MKSNLRLFARSVALCLTAALGITTASAQTAFWIGATGGEWNTPGNWDGGVVPAIATNCIISTPNIINYNNPMAAATISNVLMNGGVTLNLNTSGFNIDMGATTAAPMLLAYSNTAATININNNGAMVVTNSGILTVGTNGTITVSAGGSLTIANSINATDSMIVGQNTRLAAAGAIATLNVSGTVTMDKRLSLAGSTSGTSGVGSRVIVSTGGLLSCNGIRINNTTDDGGQFLSVDGGTVFAGDFTINKAIVSAGLLVSNGWFYATNMRIGIDASIVGSKIVGGVISNSGNFFIGDRANAATSSDRRIAFNQLGGTVYAASSLGMVICNQGNTAAAGTPENISSSYVVRGGTLFAQMLTLNNPATTANSVAHFGVSGSGALYLGTGGLQVNTPAATVVGTVGFTNGTVGALADWSSAANIALGSGNTVIQAADAGNVAHNITLNGTMSGASGAITKTGAGTLTFGGTNTYGGTTTISNGSLALSVNGSVASSQITVNSGATFDVSGTTFTLQSGKTMAGSGTVVGPFASAGGSSISPAGGNAQGTLTFANGLGVTNASFAMELTDDTSGLVKSNDAVSVVGDLTASGANTIIVTPVGTLALGTYKLIKFTGSLVGDISNFTCVSGTLTNKPGEIDLIVTSVRPTANLVWRGDGLANFWDTGISSNWLNGVSRDRFYTADTNLFNDTATNFTVNVSGIVSPAGFANITFNATNDYTLAGDGTISGSSGLTKTNSGRLTITATNGYTGVTTFSGGTVSVGSMANAGSASPIGAASAASGNVVFNGGTLEYNGGNQSINRGATLGANGGTVSVTTVSSTLTLSGSLTGPGMLTKIGNGELNLSSGNDYAGGTLISAGTVRTPQGSGATITALGTNIVTLSGVNTNATYWFGGDLEVLNNLLVITGTLNTITNSGNDTVSGVTGSGTVTLEGSGANVLTFQTADMTGFTGTFYVDTLPNLRFLPSSGTSINASGATIDLGTNVTLLNNRNGNTIQIGALIGSANSKLQGASSSDSQSTYIIGAKNLDMIYGGTITEVSGPRKVNLVKVGTGSLTFNGSIAFLGLDPILFTPIYGYTNGIQNSGSTVISNGVLTLVAPAALKATTNVTLAASTAVLDVSQEGNPDNTGNNVIITGYHEAVSGQTVAGIGTIRGGLVTDAGSTLNPGLPGSIGILTVTNSVTLGGSTFLKLVHGGTPNSDRLVSSTASAITYGGSLVVSNSGGALLVNDTFTLFSAGTLSGSFASTNLPSGYTWDTSMLGVNGTIRVTGVSASVPKIATVSLSGSLLSITAGNGNPGDPVSILSTTNVTVALTNWSVINSGNFDGTGNYNTNLTVNPAVPQQYFILRTP